MQISASSDSVGAHVAVAHRDRRRSDASASTSPTARAVARIGRTRCRAIALEQLAVQPQLDGDRLLLGADDLLLQLLQIGRDVALGVDQRLLADVVRREPWRGSISRPRCSSRRRELKRILSEPMPVRSRSRASISMRIDFESRAMARSSSSSASTAGADRAAVAHEQRRRSDRSPRRCVDHRGSGSSRLRRSSQGAGPGAAHRRSQSVTARSDRPASGTRAARPCAV